MHNRRNPANSRNCFDQTRWLHVEGGIKFVLINLNKTQLQKNPRPQYKNRYAEYDRIESGNRDFSTEELHMVKRYLRSCSTYLVLDFLNSKGKKKPKFSCVIYDPSLQLSLYNNAQRETCVHHIQASLNFSH